MAKKFLEGLAFGAGFTISFLALSYVVAFFAMPAFVSRNLITETDSLKGSPLPSSRMEGPRFHELTVGEKINEASVIALLRYEPISDGEVKAVVREFLKKEPGVDIYYGIGDEYPHASYHVSDKSDRGDGVILFFVGSPAEMRMSATYAGDRIRGLGDIPLQLFREKCSSGSS
jgi:hypothetical protein